MSMKNIPQRLAHLDDLIIQLTKPPITIQLRNQVWLVIQDLEAIAEDVKFIAKEMPAIQQDMAEHRAITAKYRELAMELLKLHENYRELYRGERPQPGA